MKERTISRKALVSASAGVLCLLAPYVAFLTGNNYSLFAAEALPLYLVGPAVGLVIGILIKLRLFAFGLFALWGCVFFAVTYLYNLDSPLSSVVAAAAIGMFIRVFRYKAATIVSIAATVHLASTLVLHYMDRSTTSELDVYRAEPTARTANDLPPVLHLVMDEFAGLRGLPREITGGRELISRLVDYYPAFGFELYSHTYSEYFNTENSLENLFNFSSENIDEIYLTRDNRTLILDKNDYFAHLLNLGYALHVYQSEFMSFCDTPGLHVASCTTYKINSLDKIEDLDMATSRKLRFIVNSFLDSWAFLRKFRHVYHLVEYELGVSLPEWPAGNSRVGPLSVMPTLSNLMTALHRLSPGEVHFAYLLLPHYPYNLDTDCAFKPLVRTWLNRTPFEVGWLYGEQNSAASREQRYAEYMAQVECTQNIIEDLFAAVQASGQWNQAIIIVHGDHGSKIVRHEPLQSNLGKLVEDDFRDAYSTFFAVKDGESIGRLDTSPISLQEALARVWGLPNNRLETRMVYMQEWPEKEMLAVPLQGFDPIPGLETGAQKNN